MTLTPTAALSSTARVQRIEGFPVGYHVCGGSTSPDERGPISCL